MKGLIVGAGGEGSRLAQFLCEDLTTSVLAPIIFTISDDDVVEEENVNVQNFSAEEIGKNKATAIANKYLGFVPLKDRIKKASQLRNFDFIVSCVDNYTARALIFKYCHENKVPYVDIRTSGRHLEAYANLEYKEIIKTIDTKDVKSYSCQTAYDKKNKTYQRMDRVAAAIAAQCILNITRGINSPLRIIIRI